MQHSLSLVCRRNNCGTRLEHSIDMLGRVVYHCPPCDRNRAGVCRDCPRRLTTKKALRCDWCSAEQRRKRQRLAAQRRYREPKLRERHLQLKRRSYQKPAVRERSLERKRRWLAVNKRPRDEFDRKYGREWMREARRDPAYRERQNQRRRELKRLRRQEAA